MLEATSVKNKTIICEIYRQKPNVQSNHVKQEIERISKNNEENRINHEFFSNKCDKGESSPIILS